MVQDPMEKPAQKLLRKAWAKRVPIEGVEGVWFYESAHEMGIAGDRDRWVRYLVNRNWITLFMEMSPGTDDIYVLTPKGRKIATGDR